MTHAINIQTKPVGLFTEVTGFVDGQVVIVVSNVSGVWQATQSHTLPAALSLAHAHVDCMQRALSRAREHGATISE